MCIFNSHNSCLRTMATRNPLSPASHADSNSETKSKGTSPTSTGTSYRCPHNTAVAQNHAVAVLDELDSLAVQGIPISTPTRKRVLQLGQSARMTIAWEAIQLETNHQLQQNNRKKGKGTGPGPQTALADKGTTRRVITSEVAEDLKKKQKPNLKQS